MTRVAAWVLLCSTLGCAATRTPDEPRAETYAPPPQSILTPDSVETRIGTLESFDGLPDDKTVEKVYDHLDFLRGVRAYMQTIPGASMMAMREGMDEAGALPNYTVLVTESLLDARSLLLTANSETVYAFAWLSLKGGPIVVETPPNVLGVFADAWQRQLAESGKAGPDKGRGGMYVIVPPAYEGHVPKSEFAVESPTYGVWAAFRGFLVDGSAEATVRNFKERLKIYPLKEAERPPPNQFVDISGRAFNTVHANDFSYFEAIHTLVQEEPSTSQDPEVLGLLASIGIEKDKPFQPDERMKAILTDAAAVGNATARAIVFDTRDEAATLYADRQWKTSFIGGNRKFERNGVRLSDARVLFHYYATINAPAKASEEDGIGPQHAVTFRDSKGRPLDGSRSYSLTLPPNVPAAYFWSVGVYDNQTRSMLQTNQRFPSISNARNELFPNDDGSITLYFGPTPPKARKQRSNWIQTVPGKGWNAILRLYGPQEPWLDKTWRPGDIELIAEISPIESLKKKPAMATEMPDSILTPDRVSTPIGTLEFVDGFPTRDTVNQVYDNLDFIRGVDAFLTTLSGASLVAMRRGFRSVGIDDNSTVGIFDRLMDSHSLFLTPNTESVYAGTWLDLREGAIVVESPPNTLGIVDDFYFRYVADLGNAGPDEGKGGLYLFVPPEYQGQVSERYFNYTSETYGNLLMWRGFPVDGDPAPAAEALKRAIRIYPFDIPLDEELYLDDEKTETGDRKGQNDEEDDDDWLEIGQDEETRFVSLSGKSFNTIHANDFTFYEEVNELIQEEPREAFGPQVLGLLASIGIEQSKPFSPDSRMRAILNDSAAVANATARAIAFRHRDPAAYLNQDSGWYTPFVGGSYRFLKGGVRLLDARTMFFYLATMTSPAMATERVGVGSQYALAATDSKGKYLDGARTYQLTLPKGVPAKDFWSIVVYDPQTRSMLQTPNTAFPSLSSQRGDVASNLDGSTTIFFGPKAPDGKESNWIQTVPGKGWFAILRLYGPRKPWFEQTWQPGEIEPAL